MEIEEVRWDTAGSFRHINIPTHSVSLSHDSTISSKHSEHSHLQNTPVIPMGAMGKERCNKCDFSITFHTVLEEHKEMKH